MLHFCPVTFQHSTEEVISKMTKIFLNPRLLAMQWFIKSNKNLPIGQYLKRTDEMFFFFLNRKLNLTKREKTFLIGDKL